MANRVTQVPVEALVDAGSPKARVTQAPLEALIDAGSPNARVTQLAIEVLVQVRSQRGVEDLAVAFDETATITVKKIPVSTTLSPALSEVATATSGAKVANTSFAATLSGTSKISAIQLKADPDDLAATLVEYAMLFGDPALYVHLSQALGEVAEWGEKKTQLTQEVLEISHWQTTPYAQPKLTQTVLEVNQWPDNNLNVPQVCLEVVYYGSFSPPVLVRYNHSFMNACIGENKKKNMGFSA